MDATTLTIEVASLDDVKKQIKAVFRGKADETHRYTFLTPEAMAQALTPPRWIILRTLTGAGPLGIRELARRVGRDVKAVHTDADALVRAGLVEKTKDRKLSFPYKRVKVAFELRAVKAA
ncbi:MAG: MarR family transcriptional regulator [Vicinamibacteria bacterium]